MKPLQILNDVELAPLLSTGTGGISRHYLQVRSAEEANEALWWARRRGLPVLLLGGGSNLLCRDGGFEGLTVDIGLQGREWEAAGDGAGVVVSAAAGENWDDFVRWTVEMQWCGLECLSGIPGRVGATPIQNVGAYGQEVADSIETVQGIDLNTLELRRYSGAECEFGYRNSRFKRRPELLVTGVTFRLRAGPPATPKYPGLVEHLPERATVAQIREVVLSTRRAKSMVFDPEDPNHRSCGSFFVNPILTPEQLQRLLNRWDGPPPPQFPQPDGRSKVPAAWLIERAGFQRGDREGPVGLSTQHTLCLVCHQGASTALLLALADRIKTVVHSTFGVLLEQEPQVVGIPPELTQNS